MFRTFAFLEEKRKTNLFALTFVFMVAAFQEKMREGLLLMLLCFYLSSGCRILALPYDYTATTECLIEPHRSQYGGGVLINPEFSLTTEGWTVFGQGAVKVGISKNGNRYAVAHKRSRSTDSISQKVQMEKGKLYSFSAWVQIDEGSESVAAIFRNASGALVPVGKVIARKGCWSLLKGGALGNYSSPVEILFESKNTATEIWVDSVSLQPFTMEQWRSHQDESTKKGRKSNVSFQVTYGNGTPVEGAMVSIKQTKSNFPFGCGMNHHITTSKDYRKWFASKFKYTTFTNEMKWYSTEKVKGQENYTVADAMVTFCQENGISIRGHNIFWDDSKYNLDWVKNLTSDELRTAAAKRIDSVVTRYSGKLIAWDVMNENLHFRFFENRLGSNASSEYFARAYQLDPNTRMFMNEYNTIENCHDETASPCNYKKRLEEIQSYPGNEDIPVGIGVQGHFNSDQPNLAYMRSSLHILASTGLPIWLTEVDVDRGPNQADYLDQDLREAYSHPAVEGIIMFVGPAVAGFNVTTLADQDFKNTPSGDVVDMLIKEWGGKIAESRTDTKGSFETSLVHGDYNITVKDPVTNSMTSLSYKVTKDVSRGAVQIILTNA